MGRDVGWHRVFDDAPPALVKAVFTVRRRGLGTPYLAPADFSVTTVRERVVRTASGRRVAGCSRIGSNDMCAGRSADSEGSAFEACSMQ